MKIQPIMQEKDQLEHVAYYSDFTVKTAPEHAQYIVEERISAAGLLCSGDLDYPAAKTINILSPVTKQRRWSYGQKKLHFSASENTANKVFAKELLSNNLVNKSRTTSLSNYGVNKFNENLRESLLLEKINRLIGAGSEEISESSSCKCDSSATVAPKKVRFSEITIQEYTIEPGDNPGGTSGCPLTIGWEPISSNTIDIDSFEDVRQTGRRTFHQLKLVQAHRQNLLLGMGYSMRSIMAGTKAANLTRRDRYATIARLHSIKSQEIMEGFRNNVHNLVTFGKKRRLEQKFLAPFKEIDRGSHGLKLGKSHCVSAV